MLCPEKHMFSLLNFIFLFSVSPVCLLQFSGQHTAHLFSRWSVMIRELLEDISLLKCSTAVSFWRAMLKCPQRTLEQCTVSWNRLLRMQGLNLSLSVSKWAACCLLSSSHLIFRPANRNPLLIHTFMKMVHESIAACPDVVLVAMFSIYQQQWRD